MPPRIACLCPTYKRPQHLANALACFFAQWYSDSCRRLYIFDDANQFTPVDSTDVRIDSCRDRFKSLPKKYNQMAEIAKEWKPDIYVVWEDDDVFLPWHLIQIAEAYELGAQFIRPKQVYSNYGQPFGTVIKEDAIGRFHSSWAYASTLFWDLGGYPDTGRLDFDQRMGGLCAAMDPKLVYCKDWKPSYVYRWNNGVYHGSQAGEDGYQSLWDGLGMRTAPPVGSLIPAFDEETTLIFKSFGLNGASFGRE
jgi:hypothetical protein